MIALLPSSVLKINNTAVERTNWFGEMKKGISSSRPIRSEALRWIVIRIFQGLEIIHNNSMSSRSKKELFSLTENILSSFPPHIQELLQKEEEERKQENSSNNKNNNVGPTKIIAAPKYLQHEVNMKIISIFPSSTRDILQNEDYLRNYFSPVVAKNNVSSSNNSSSKNSMSSPPELGVDVRWTVQELEEKLVKEVLKMNFEPHQSELYKSIDTWAIIDVELARWRHHNFELSAQQKCEKLWSWCFPSSKSVSLYYVDREMFENDGARKRGMFLKPLWRSQATLFSFGKISDGDMILVVVN